MEKEKIDNQLWQNQKSLKHLKGFRGHLEGALRNFQGSQKPLDQIMIIFIKSLICINIVAVITVALLLGVQLDMIRMFMQQGQWTKPFLMLGGASLFITYFALLWRALLVWKYRPAPDCADEDLPQ